MSRAVHGFLTALLTPMTPDGRIDEKAFVDFVNWQIAQGIHGIVPCGTTGETPTLLDDEDALITRLSVEVAAGKIPVVAGCGSNSTEHAIFATQRAQKLGIDAALHVVPYYNKPTQEGLYAHFRAIHDASDIPIYIYNIPGRSIVSMSIDTMARLAELPRIVGVKDATGVLERPPKTRIACGEDFVQLSGNDETALAFFAQGGVGCVSVLSNVAPALCVEMYQAWRTRDIPKAQAINVRLAPLIEALFAETSPAPVKYAASLLGLCNNVLRLPLVPIGAATEAKVRDAMVFAGIKSNENV